MSSVSTKQLRCCVLIVSTLYIDIPDDEPIGTVRALLSVDGRQNAVFELGLAEYVSKAKMATFPAMADLLGIKVTMEDRLVWSWRTPLNGVLVDMQDSRTVGSYGLDEGAVIWVRTHELSIGTRLPSLRHLLTVDFWQPRPVVDGEVNLFTYDEEGVPVLPDDSGIQTI